MNIFWVIGYGYNYCSNEVHIKIATLGNDKNEIAWAKSLIFLG